MCESALASMYGDLSIHDKNGISGNQLFFLVIGRKIAKHFVNDLLYFIGLKIEGRCDPGNAW